MTRDDTVVALVASLEDDTVVAERCGPSATGGRVIACDRRRQVGAAVAACPQRTPRPCGPVGTLSMVVAPGSWRRASGAMR
jgi:hypothetical protein